jgi:hypothetical protein
MKHYQLVERDDDAEPPKPRVPKIERRAVHHLVGRGGKIRIELCLTDLPTGTSRRTGGSRLARTAASASMYSDKLSAAKRFVWALCVRSTSCEPSGIWYVVATISTGMCAPLSNDRGIGGRQYRMVTVR